MIIGLESPSPAKRAELKEGDIIVEFDTRSISNSNQIFKLLTPDKIFQPVKLKVLRQTKLFDIDIFPVERPAA